MATEMEQHDTSLPSGTAAPDFELPSGPDQTVSLSALRGRPVILAFYPADWSPVCGDQMALYNEILPEFQRFGAELLGISVDGVWCHLAFAQDRKLHFPLLADFEPKGEVARAYGVYRAPGRHERAGAVRDRRATASSAGATSRRSASTPARTASCARSRDRVAEKGGTLMKHRVAVAASPCRSARRDHIQGPADAPVTLVEYGDYECPYCGAAYPIVKEVQERLGDRLRFVFRNFPLATSHPHAEHAAEAAEAAGGAGQVLGDARPALRESGSASPTSDLRGYAAQLGLDVDAFDSDLAEHDATPRACARTSSAASAAA